MEVELSYPMSYFQQLLAVPAFYPLNEAFVEKRAKTMVHQLSQHFTMAPSH